MIRRGSGASSSIGIGSILGISPPLLSLGHRRSHRCVGALLLYCRSVSLSPGSLSPASVSLKDRVAVVTGGGAGIRPATARGFAALVAPAAILATAPDTFTLAATEVKDPGLKDTERQYRRI